MNIAIDIRSLMHPNRTGVGEYTHELLSALFTLDQKNQYWLFYNSAKSVNVPKFNFPNVHYAKFSYPNKLLNFSLKIFNYPKIDKLIQHKFKTTIDLFFFPNLIFFAVACPYIITCHDLSFELFPSFYSLKRRLWHWFINPSKLYHRARSIISVSHHTCSDLIKTYHLPAAKIITIHSGISTVYKKLDLTDPGKDRVRQKYSLPSKFFLFLGTLEPRKNIETLILAYNRNQDIHPSSTELVIAGAPGWKYKTIYRLIEHSKYSSKIHLINFVAQADKVYLYNMAQVFIFPSFYEGFGFPPLEALASGTPVIASHVSSLPEILGQNASYIDPYNVQDLADGLNSSLTESPKAVDFPWPTTAARVLTLFNNFNPIDNNLFRP
ncbi:TPA: hypothetical protein DF272_04160 [Candidatus Falkowbacteria bacterium]|nr:hypothetical protein [Candidatus Falkowbacteria bacterium]